MSSEEWKGTGNGPGGIASEQEPAQGGSPVKKLLVLLAVVVGVGGLGWAIYLREQEQK